MTTQNAVNEVVIFGQSLGRPMVTGNVESEKYVKTKMNFNIFLTHFIVKDWK